jgi:hypothetical protein
VVSECCLMPGTLSHNHKSVENNSSFQRINGFLTYWDWPSLDYHSNDSAILGSGLSSRFEPTHYYFSAENEFMVRLDDIWNSHEQLTLSTIWGLFQRVGIIFLR